MDKICETFVKYLYSGFAKLTFCQATHQILCKYESGSTHQILVLVEHVKLIWSELAAPVEEIVHCVVARLGPQVGVLHVRQNPMVCLSLVQLVRTWDPQVCNQQKICLDCCRHLRHQRHHRRHHDHGHLLNDKGESGGELLLHLPQLQVLLRALQVGGRPTLIVIMLMMIVVTMLVLMITIIMLTMPVLMRTCAILGTRLAMLKMSSKMEVTCVTVLNSLQFLCGEIF